MINSGMPKPVKPSQCELFAKHINPEVQRLKLRLCLNVPKIDQNVTLHCGPYRNQSQTLRTTVTDAQKPGWIDDWMSKCVVNVSESNVILSVFPEGTGSRRRRPRRSLLNKHSHLDNKRLKVAHYTANVTKVSTPCWVCSFFRGLS